MTVSKVYIFAVTFFYFYSTVNSQLNCYHDNDLESMVECQSMGDKNNILVTMRLNGVIDDLKNLKVIRMNDCKLIHVMDSAFVETNMIEELDLSRNKLVFLKIGVYRSLTNLTKLNLSSNKIPYFDPDDWAPLTKLKELDISRNNLNIDLSNEIPSDTLSKLEELDVSYSEDILMISPLKAPNLKRLFLSHSNITLGRRTFNLCTNVTELDLSHTNLKSLQRGVFDSLNQLEYLHLSHNKMETYGLPVGIFSRLSKLTYLDLSHNSMELFSYERLFQSLKLLTDLNVAGNGLVSLQRELFSSNVELISMNLSTNLLNKLPDEIFAKLTNLELLDLSQNTIKTLPTNIFEKNTKLSILYLSKNALTTLDGQLLSANTLLTYLDLSENKLTEIKIDIFKNLKDLSNLRLESNSLNQLPDDLLYTLKVLSELCISCNNLTRLPSDFFTRESNDFSGLSLNLDGNPWQCSCLNSLLQEVEDKMIDYSMLYFTDGETPSCVGSVDDICDIYGHKSFNLSDWYETHTGSCVAKI